ncbi:MAG: SDR family NAD(P)-dependent oxidoreductase, partial [Anaerolineaceae bacterium]|nr:SDR family NAD(P)-dependent oxidoreductase [Anaerolineaceae bacterium]
MRLLDKVAIVTGSANGIGKGIALKLAEHGAKIVVSDISLMAAEDLCEKIEELGRKAIPVKADVAKMDEVEQMVNQAIAEFNRVDILVSNAGIRKDAPIQHMTDAQWDRVID